MRPLFLRVLILTIIFTFSFPSIGRADVHVSANNAVLIEQESGRILFEKKSHEQRPIASLTKVMTAIIAIEYGQLDDVVMTSKRAIYTHGSSIYLQDEEEMTLEDLLYGLMLRSGNDASIAIAEHIGGSVEGFAYLMNEKASYIGMTNSKFAADGLDEPNHYSTAYDLALLMQYAMNNDKFREISETTSYRSKNRTYNWNNKNKLLTKLYPHCTGGKTGFTKKAGRTLVTTAEKDGLELIAVTLNASNDWNDHISLYEWGFKNFELTKLMSSGKQMFQLFDGEKIEAEFFEDVLFPLRADELSKVKKQTIINKYGENYIGQIVYTLDKETIKEVPIIPSEQKDQSTYLSRLLHVMKQMMQVKDNG